MSTRPTSSTLGAADESDLNQTLGDTGGMSGSLAIGLFAGGNTNQSATQGAAPKASQLVRLVNGSGTQSSVDRRLERITPEVSRR